MRYLEDTLTASITFDFGVVDQYVSNVRRLIDDGELRRSILQANHDYCRRYIRPDAIVSRSLETALRAGRLAAPRTSAAAPDSNERAVERRDPSRVRGDSCDFVIEHPVLARGPP